MREKDIKRQVLKQLKKEFPNWRRLSRKGEETDRQGSVAERGGQAYQ
jgi:hypothetical protein